MRVVHHIDGNPLNNELSNLREMEMPENPPAKARAKRTPPSCRNCAYWMKPAKTPARKDFAYPCKAPVPTADYPDSISVRLERHSTTRDDGSRCPAWEPIW